jgi:hypothetical protein
MKILTPHFGKFLQGLTLLSAITASTLCHAWPVIDGYEWYQPANLEYNYSWNDFNTACPGGTCAGQLGLSGPDLTGWIWASVDDVNTLFNTFISASDGINPLGPGPSTYSNPASTFGLDFISAFLPTWEVDSGMAGVYVRGVMGWVRDESPANSGFGLVAEIRRNDDSCCGDQNVAKTDIEQQKDFHFLDGGAWLFRPASQAIPAPSVPGLLLLGLAVAAWVSSRRPRLVTLSRAGSADLR